jgi:soluble lytic murein transglycosylase
LIGCSRHPGSCTALPVAAPPAASSAQPEVTKAIERDLLDEPDDASDSREAIDLVRREAWAEAQASLEALPEAKKQKPTLRLLRARVAMARGDNVTASIALADLEKGLPFIAAEIERWRAEAEAEAGPFQRAAEYFSKQSGAKAMARAAFAYEKAGMADEARAAADRAIAAERQEGAQAPLRALRARLLLASEQKGAAVEDLRFIVLKAPASAEAKKASEQLESLDPDHPLTTKERLARADRLVDAGRTDDALAELDRADKTAVAGEKEDIVWARAFTLFRARGRNEKAAALFTKLGAKTGPRQAEALFHAARARSRADLDDQAAAEYRALAKRFPTSPWADDALYLAARLAFVHGSWAHAAAQYETYLHRFPRGKERDSAAYEHALSLLAGGKYEKARTELRDLASGASGGEAARLHELEGLAALRSYDRQGARALWTDTIRSQPLTWGSMAARSRLAEMGAALPPFFDPPEDKAADEPSSFPLPAVAQFFHRLGLDADAEAYLRAHEREAVSANKGREKEALCAMYGEIERASRGYRVGLEGVPSTLLARAPSASSEWGWRCLYPRPYRQRVEDLEGKEQLAPGLVYAIMRQESAYDPDALSSAKAVGLLQLMPDTARRVAGELGIPFDEAELRTPGVNLELGARYLSKMVRSFDGSIAAAAAAYNAGPKAVRRWLTRMKALDLDLWVAVIPFEETRLYVGKVMSNLAHYAYLRGGEEAVPTVALNLPAAGNEAPAEY